MSNKVEALNKSTEYFNGDELAASVFVGKYALKNGDEYIETSPLDMHKNRLAPEFARIEAKYKNPISEDVIFEAIKDFGYVVPQGSPMSAICNDYAIQSASNCFVIGSPEDSMGGIHRTDEEQAQLAKRRAGIGLDISKIRPKNLKTNNAAGTTDGIGVFMERFSNTIREVAQNGRRGALMLTCSIHHPEVETFINIKKDKTKVTGANISVKLSDEFMNAVKNNSDYEQRWPIDSKNPKVVKKINARAIWNQIVDAAWESAEPGLLFWDNALKNTPSDIYSEFGFTSVSTNPCQPAWAKVLTPNGIKELGEILIGDVIWSNEGWTTVLNKWSTGIKKVNQYKTRSGSFYGTENHPLISEGLVVEAKDCETIDICVGEFINSSNLYIRDIMDGLVIGDGSVHTASNTLVHLNIGENDKDYFDSEISSLILKHRPGLHDYAYEVETSISADELPLTYNRSIPKRFLYGNRNKLAGFLRGLFSANGTVSGDRVCLKATSFEIIEQVQMMLSALGIRSYYSTNKSKNIKFSNGEYCTKQSYDVNITTDRIKFSNIIGFIQKYKNTKLDEVISRLTKSDKPNKISYEVVEVNFVSEEEVFDITVDNNSHTYWTCGLNVHNCGEILLSPYDSCRLITLNLYSFVKNKFTENAFFDFTLYSKYVKIAQRLMDDLVDIEINQIDKILAKIESDPESDDIKSVELGLWNKIRNACLTGRRTGLGITGLGDTLASLNIRYGSEESIEVTEKIYKELALNAYMSSIDMAEERGHFPIWSYQLEKDHPFVSKIISNLPKEYQDKYKKFGRRNIALTTTAPTGSVSMLTKTTSGIEPAFSVKYSRRKKINPSDLNAKVDYVDTLGDKWQVFDVYHHAFKEWMDVTGLTYEDYDKSPYYKATSNDVDWMSSVKIQAVAQKWICHSISKTCNLPNNATKELVAEVYMSAWEEGCKGFTVYRDGCRDGVLVTSNTKVESKDDNKVNLLTWDRPEKLECDVHHVNISGESWVIFVGKSNEGIPCELFGGLSSKVVLPKKLKHGHIVKTKNKRGDISVYDLSYGEGEDNAIIKDIGKIFENPTQGDFTRAFSLMLRAGIPIHLIVNQMQKNEESDMYSFSRVVSRVLKKYIKEGTTIKQKCPNCGSESLVYVEGCLTCSSCGHSKCG